MRYNIPKLLQLKLFKRLFFRLFYEFTAGISYIKKINLPFMNLGYYNNQNIELKSKDEKNRNYIQLYHNITKNVEIENKNILEISCGRGGGCNYYIEYLNAKEVIGIDISKINIIICKKYYTNPKLKFIKADAENFSFPENSFDVVINLESSHTYLSKQRFFKNVTRALNPDGYFVYADIFINKLINQMENQFIQENLIIINKEDITENILKSIDQEDISKKYPLLNKIKIFKFNLFRNLAVFKDSDTYNYLKNRELIYNYYILKKKL